MRVQPSSRFEATSSEIQLSDEDLKRMYGLMVLTRVTDTQAVSLQRQGRIGFYVTCEGEEAAEVGSTYALGPRDWIFPDYRGSGIAIARGMSLQTLFAQVLGNGRDLLKGRSMPSHWGSKALNIVAPSSPICTQLPHAVGLALGAKMKGDPIVAITYFGDGGTSSNDFHSGMNFAAVFKTPTIFFCRNNGYAISVPLRRQTATRSLVVKASAYNMEGVQVDGNDILAVYAATKRAIEKAREGGGPTFIEAITYRLGAHTTSDDPTRYREAGELEAMRLADPIVRFKNHLIETGRWTEEEDAELTRSSLQKVKEAFSEVEAAPPVTIGSLFEDVYSEPTRDLVREAEQLRQETGED
jgi:pyruvate dehydrogenase E1 component alpha subunit